MLATDEITLVVIRTQIIGCLGCNSFNLLLLHSKVKSEIAEIVRPIEQDRSINTGRHE